MDKSPSGSPEMYKGTEANVSPSTLLDRNNSKIASDSNIPILFIFLH